MNSYAYITGHEQVLQHFGYWPSFHDAEVLSMCFSRDPIMEAVGPSLVAKVHAFEMKSGANPKTGFKFIKHCIITFQFDQLEKLHFEGFNFQNAIYGLHFESARGQDGQKISVEFEPAYGVECSFDCSSVLITSIEDGIPASSVYGDR